MSYEKKGDRTDWPYKAKSRSPAQGHAIHSPSSHTYIQQTVLYGLIKAGVKEDDITGKQVTLHVADQNLTCNRLSYPHRRHCVSDGLESDHVFSRFSMLLTAEHEY